MKQICCYTLFFFACLMENNCLSQSIPAERRTDWTLAGYHGTIPVYSSIVNILDHGGSGDGITANDAALQNAIAALNNQEGVIIFPAGTYLFNAGISVRSGLVLRGEDANNSVLQFNLGGANNLIVFAGSLNPSMAVVTAAVSKNQSSMIVDNPGGFQVNDYIKIYQHDNELINDDWALASVGQVLHLENISGDTIFFSNPLRKNYALTDTPRIRKFNVITNSGIECLKIKRLDQTVTGNPKANINFLYAAKCWVKGIESDSANFAHIEIGDSKNIEVTNCYFHGAFDYGTGKGYGISCEFTSGDCLIENNIFKHLRHSMLIQAGANGNVFDYNYSIEPHKSESIPYDLAGDIVMHGNYPYMNLFESNIVQNILIDQSHGINGPYNTVFRNRAESYGIIISAGAGDSSNIIGNEITGTGLGKGNYTITGNGNLEYGNNKNNTILPAGTTTLNDTSYVYHSLPAFWNVTDSWPSIGIPNIFNSGNIPAGKRYISGSGLSFCVDALPVVYTFNGTGNWNIASNWINNTIPPSLLSPGSQIIIDPSGECILNVPYVVNPGVTLTVIAGKNFIINSNLAVIQ